MEATNPCSFRPNPHRTPRPSSSFRASPYSRWGQRISHPRRRPKNRPSPAASSRSRTSPASSFGTDFVTVTKAEDAEWDHMKPAILGAIMEHFQSGAPVMEGEAQAGGGHAEHHGEDGGDRGPDQVASGHARASGGWRRMVATSPSTAFDRGVVYLHMQGACAGCPSSTLTLKDGYREPAPALHPRSARGAPCQRLTRSFLALIHRPRIARPLCCRATG